MRTDILHRGRKALGRFECVSARKHARLVRLFVRTTNRVLRYRVRTRRGRLVRPNAR